MLAGESIGVTCSTFRFKAASSAADTSQVTGGARGMLRTSTVAAAVPARPCCCCTTATELAAMGNAAPSLVKAVTSTPDWHHVLPEEAEEVLPL